MLSGVLMSSQVNAAETLTMKRVRFNTSTIERDSNRSVGKTRILIADDHLLFRDGLRMLLNGEECFRVVGEAADVEPALQMVREQQPDILLLDWALSRREGMRILRGIMAAGLSVRTILLTVPVDKPDIVKAIQLGAFGVLPLDATSEMLFEGIRKAMEGEYCLGQEGVASLVCELRGHPQTSQPHSAKRQFGLTRREFEIVVAVVAGYSNLEIAETFSLSSHTVKHHIGHVFDKLGVSNRLELALFAVNHHLVVENS